MDRRIKKEILPSEILAIFKDKNKTVSQSKIIQQLQKRLQKQEENRILQNWVENHYLKNDFDSWWKEQKTLTTNKKNNIRINILKKNFDALTINKIQFLAEFLTQNKITKKITIDFETLKAGIIL